MSTVTDVSVSSGRDEVPVSVVERPASGADSGGAGRQAEGGRSGERSSLVDSLASAARW